MIHALLKAGAVLALGSAAFGGPALAASTIPFNAPSLIILAQDEENAEVWHDLRPDVTPPEAAVGKHEEAPKGSVEEHPMGQGSGGDIENQEIWHDLETGETPPRGE
jgi:hypothetical protein